MKRIGERKEEIKFKKDKRKKYLLLFLEEYNSIQVPIYRSLFHQRQVNFAQPIKKSLEGILKLSRNQ